jgi:hypothetical protein
MDNVQNYDSYRWIHCTGLHHISLSSSVFSLLSLSLKYKSKLWDHITARVSVCVAPYEHSNDWASFYETWYFMAPEPISTACFCVWVCVCVCVCVRARVRPSVRPSIIIKQGLGEHVRAATLARDNRRIIGRIIFFAVRVISKKRLWACLRAIWSRVPKGGPIPRHTGRLTVGRKTNSNSNLNYVSY